MSPDTHNELMLRKIVRSELLRKDRLRRAYEKDLQARVLIGARLRREVHEQVKEAAARQGISVYRWVVNAIERALRS